jgi:hypothetical protein
MSASRWLLLCLILAVAGILGMSYFWNSDGYYLRAASTVVPEKSASQKIYTKKSREWLFSLLR